MNSVSEQYMALTKSSKQEDFRDCHEWEKEDEARGFAKLAKKILSDYRGVILPRLEKQLEIVVELARKKEEN